jgi:hypothetical protein
MIIKMTAETLQALQAAIHTAREDVPAAPAPAPAVTGLATQISEALSRCGVPSDASDLLDSLRSAAHLVDGMIDDIGTPGSEWEHETHAFIRASVADLAAVAIRAHAFLLEERHVR